MGGGMVIREAGDIVGRHGWRIECPAQTKIDGQLGGYLPLVRHEREKLPRAVGRKGDGQIASSLARLIEQEARKGVSEAGVGAWNGGLVVTLIEAAAPAKGLRLQQRVADTPHVEA